jgi:hypothetical protein
MISHEHRVIFIHIPKCAGTSVEQALGHFDDYAGRERQDHRTIRHIERPVGLAALMTRENRSILAARLRARRRASRNPRNDLTVTARQFRDYYKFTIIRDPWSRVRSWYRNVQRDPLHQKSLGGPMPFDAFVRRHAGRGMLAPVPWWIDRFDGSCPMDRIVRFDALHEGLAEVAAEAALPRLRDLPHLLASEAAGSAAPDDSQDIRRLIADTYAAEIARFGFRNPA